jgi:hypothetical protein
MLVKPGDRWDEEMADKNFELLKANPRQSSLRLKKIGGFWTTREK